MTDSARPDPRAFRERLLKGEPVIGTFMKTPTSHNSEILAGLGYDYLVLDQEHAPWTRTSLDMGLLGCKAYGAAGVVRIATPDATNILSVLDDGAIGILVPHVDTPEKARNIVSWSHYKGGSRGAGIGRAGDYGNRGGDIRAFADSTTTVIAMIEDRQALDQIDEICATPGIDAFFLGRGDLGLSLSNAEGPAPTLKEAVEMVCAACRKHNKVISALVTSADSDEAKWLMDLGMTAMMIGNDQGFMRSAANNALQGFRKAYGIG